MKSRTHFVISNHAIIEVIEADVHVLKSNYRYTNLEKFHSVRKIMSTFFISKMRNFNF